MSIMSTSIYCYPSSVIIIIIIIIIIRLVCICLYKCNVSATFILSFHFRKHAIFAISRPTFSVKCFPSHKLVSSIARPINESVSLRRLFKIATLRRATNTKSVKFRRLASRFRSLWRNGSRFLKADCYTFLDKKNICDSLEPSACFQYFFI